MIVLIQSVICRCVFFFFFFLNILILFIENVCFIGEMWVVWGVVVFFCVVGEMVLVLIVVRLSLVFKGTRRYLNIYIIDGYKYR